MSAAHRKTNRQVRYFCQCFDQAGMKAHSKQAGGLLYRCLFYSVDTHPDFYDRMLLAIGRKAIEFGYDVDYVANAIRNVCEQRGVELPL